MKLFGFFTLTGYTSPMKPQSFIFMGRYGSGKGTQSTLLIEALKKIDTTRTSLYIQTGQEFRSYTQESSYTAALTKKTIDSGRLMPEFMCVYLWGRLIAQKYTGSEYLVFDGTPRKLMEAQMLESLFPFYGLEKPWVIYLDVEHEEASSRLSIRARSSGRPDDGKDQVEVRRKAYEADIVPSIEYYRTNPNVNFLDIDGERSIEDIHADIVKKLGLE